MTHHGINVITYGKQNIAYYHNGEVNKIVLFCAWWCRVVRQCEPSTINTSNLLSKSTKNYKG